MGKFIVHPWKFDLLCLIDSLYSFESVELCIIFRVLYSLDGLLQFVVGIDNICLRNHWLSDVLVFEKHCVSQSLFSCLFDKNNMHSLMLF